MEKESGNHSEVIESPLEATVDRNFSEVSSSPQAALTVPAFTEEAEFMDKMKRRRNLSEDYAYDPAGPSSVDTTLPRKPKKSPPPVPPKKGSYNRVEQRYSSKPGKEGLAIRICENHNALNTDDIMV